MSEPIFQGPKKPTFMVFDKIVACFSLLLYHPLVLMLALYIDLAFNELMDYVQEIIH